MVFLLATELGFTDYCNDQPDALADWGESRILSSPGVRVKFRLETPAPGFLAHPLGALFEVLLLGAISEIIY